MSSITYKHAAFTAALLLAAGAAFAQTPPAVGIEGQDFGVFTTLGRAFGAEGGILGKLEEYQDHFLAAGRWLLALVAVMMIAFGGIRALLGDALEDVVAQLFRGVMTFAVPFLALAAWGDVAGIFVDGMMRLTEGFAGSDPLSAASSLVGAVGAGREVFTSISWLDVSALPAFFVWLFGSAVIGAAMLWLLFNLFMAFFLPQIFMAIGMIVGPLLVVWLPFGPLSAYARKWVDFMVANGISLLVASIIIAATSGVIADLLGVARAAITQQDMWQATSTPLIAYLVSASTMILIGSILGQSRDIAQGLVGSVAAGGGRAIVPKMPKPETPKPTPGAK